MRKRDARGVIRRVAAAGLAVLTAATMAVSSPLTAIAAEAGSSSGAVTLDKTATPLDENDQTNVKLSIGSTESKDKVAVLFVFDYSTSVSVRNAALQMANELSTKENTDIKVAVVNFNREASSEGWVDFSSLSDAEKTALFTETQTGGTNYHAGLLMAQSLLSDSEIDGYTPYLVTVSDGVTYLWNDDTNGDGTLETSSVWANYDAYNAAGSSIQNGSGAWVFKYVDKGVTYGFEYRYEGGITEFLQSASSLYQVTKDAGLVRPYYGSDYPFSSEPDGTKAVLYGSTYNGDMDWMETTGQATQILTKASDGNTTTPVEEGTNYLVAPEVAVYKTATTFGELVNTMESEGYGNNVFALRCPEQDGSTTWSSNPYGLELMQYMAGLTDTKVDDVEMGNSTASETFSGIRDEILYEIQSGEVTDMIGSDFDLVSFDSLQMTVGGKTVTGTVDAENNTVTFGDGYVVTYSKAADGTETLTWKINAPVEAANGITLSYDLQLVNKSTVPGTYHPKTNESATLDYVRHDGSTGEETFPVPVLEYTVEEPAPVTPDPITVSGDVFNVTKVLEGATLKDGQFEFQLADADGNVIATATNDAEGNVVFDDFTFEAAGTYKYSVSEVLPTDDDPNTDGVQKDGVTYDQTVEGLMIEVTEKDGKLTYQAYTDEDGATFNNVYKAAEAPAEDTKPADDTKKDETVPSTGDPTSFAAVAATLVAGVGAGAAGIAMRRRNK